MKNKKNVASILGYSDSALNKIVFSHTVPNMSRRIAKAAILFLGEATDKEIKKFLKFYEFSELKVGRKKGFSPFLEAENAEIQSKE